MYALAIAVLLVFISGHMQGCVQRELRKNIVVVADTPTYRIRQTEHTKEKSTFLIWAVSNAAAEKAANEILNCNRRPCMIQPAGVVVIVDKPNLKN